MIDLIVYIIFGYFFIFFYLETNLIVRNTRLILLKIKRFLG